MNKYKIFIIILFIAIILLSCLVVVYQTRPMKSILKTEKIIETVDDNGKYTTFYYEKEFKALKKENKELYDSLKKQQKYIESLVQFHYKGKVKTDTVFVNKKETISEEIAKLEDKTYTYKSESDTINYELEINSKIEPNWYKFDAEINDKFTIVNKQYKDGEMSTDIESSLGNDITDVIVWQNTQKKKWYENFSFGPSVSIGYDPLNRNFGVMVGVGITYNILGK